MPVVVTGAGLPLGRALLAALADQAALAGPGVPDLRAVVRDRADAAALRASGVRVSVGDLSDPLRLGAVLEGAYTVVHLDTGPDGAGSPLDTWEWLLDAAEDTGLRRIVTVVPYGALVPEISLYDTVFLPGEIRGATGTPDAALVARLVAADGRR
ncbi:NAD(P)H-binding protein [Yinghuangia soli]|uniref:NAD(P)H-binding protein n=1 Tax=Yinghuangia soli TaxID=2908204 RepID=A0AA41PZC2_9ACTN|nr:NAD(P)H-binding protein [Yinghuangia soli]MCF2528655.1 NAD(P)H-binding protein [Yinghuangia soli]